MLTNLLIIYLTNLLIIIQLINCTKIRCNYKLNPNNGCPEESQSVCNNKTGFCECNRNGFEINFIDQYCLPKRNIDEKCYVSDQCLKTSNPWLKCYYLDTNAIQAKNSLIELDKSDAIQLFRLTNKRLEGFCRCHYQYYYDYERNVCVNQNETLINNKLNIGSNPGSVFDCNEIECKFGDENSYCDSVSKMCVCNNGFVKNVNQRCTRIKSLHENCSPFDQCIDRNSYCNKELNICVCSNGYHPDLLNQKCFKSRSLYERCDSDKECNSGNAICDSKTKTCECNDHSIPYGSSIRVPPTCVRRTTYGDVCYEDINDDKSGDKVCSASGQHLICSKYTNRCVCEEGYVFRGDKCKPFNINRYGFEDEFMESQKNKNPMTYILIVFCSIFGFTIFASILIKMFRRRNIASPNYANTNLRNQYNSNIIQTDVRPSAPPVYSDSGNTIQMNYRDRLRNLDSGNEEKPPSYEEATAGYVIQ